MSSDKQKNQTLVGTAGDDRLNGGQGDDVLIGSGGNDYLDGGPGGDDVAVYSGNYADYKITFSAGPTSSEGYKITVVDLRAGSPDGTDTLRRIDELRFADGVYEDGRFISSNHPAVIGMPTLAEVTEDVSVAAGYLTAQGTISITDADAGQASFQTSVTGAAGNLGTLILASNGSYLYAVDNSAVQYLGAADSKVDSFTISSLDGTAKTVRFTIGGANDSAVIGTPTVSSVTEDVAISKGNLTATGSISITDVDQNQSSFNTTVTGAAGNLGSLVLAANGSYTYTVANSALQYLGAGDSKIDSFTIRSADGTAKSLNLTINGANDAAVIGTPTVSSVTEDVAVGANGMLTATGRISISDVDQSQSSFNTTVTGAASNLGVLALASNGTYTYSVANAAVQYLGTGVKATDSFTVTSIDGTSKTVRFTINGANDAPTITDNYGVTTAPNTRVAGSVGATDVDSGDALVYSLDTAHKPAHGTVSVTAATGSYTYTPSKNYTGADSFNIVVSDGHGGSATAAVSVNVTSGPINHNPILSGTQATLAGGTEDTAYSVSASNLLAGFTDQDGDTMSVANLAANHGTVTDNGNGSYTITPAANYNGPVALSYTVIDGKGGHIAATQTFNLGPVNDPALIGGATSGSVTEAGGIANGTAGAPTASGTLTDIDVDNAPNTFLAVPAGRPSSYGTFAMTAGGVWTYNLDNANATVQGLNANQTLTDGFTVQSVDGTSQLVTITIRGANDAPVLAVPAAIDYTDTEQKNTFTAITGTLFATDVDDGAAQTYGITGGTLSSALADYDWAKAGPHGTLHLNSASGAYSFVPDSSSINALAAGASASDTFTLTVSDGAGGTDSQTLTVNLHGANDAAVISGVSGPLQYIVGQANPTVVAPNLSLGDVDSTSLTSAIVAISAGLHAGNDVLAYQLPAGSPITGNFDSATGVLTFSGNGTLAQYQAALDSVTFHTSIIGERTISFTVFDGLLASATVDTSNISLESLTTEGFKIPGEAAGDNSGTWMSAAGDVNGDGFADLIIGAPSASPNGNLYSGRSYVVFGKGSAFDPEVPLWSLDGNNGFGLSGVAAGDVSGFSVAAAGDVNGDGFSDVIIGAIYSNPNGIHSGAAYVVFGKPNGAGGFGPDFQLSSLVGSNGFRLDGAAEGDQTGISVSGVGDVNGDGYADVLVGSYFQPSGASYLVFGKASGFASNVQLANLNGTDGFRIVGESPHDNAGQRVSAAGDVNGDGFADFIIGAPGDFRVGYAIGTDYVVFGKSSFFGQATDGAAFDLSNIDGSNGFRMHGLANADGTGIGINKAGDINGDGFDDIVVSARYASVGGVVSGASYVVFGQDGGFAKDLDLSTLDGSHGFRVVGGTADSLTGFSVSAAGDFNGDGFGDLIVGAPGVYGSPTWSGESYVIFGKATGFPADLNLATLGGADGFRVSGVANGDASGYNVSAAGDVNGDGFADIAVSSARASPHGQTGAGETYVIFGAKLVVGGETYLGGPGSDTLTGTPAAESFIGGQGNDTIIGGGGKDAFSGGAGDDTIHLGASGSSVVDFVNIDGGSGFDTLVLDGSGVTLDLMVPGTDRINSIERIDLGSGGNSSLVLRISDVLHISSTTHQLFVTGTGADSLTSAGGWVHETGAHAAVTGSDGHTYASYTLGGAAYVAGMANLLIDQALLTANVHLT